MTNSYSAFAPCHDTVVGRCSRFKTAYCLFLLMAFMALCPAVFASFDGIDMPPRYLRDRGPGMPTSMFGTYVRSGELLLYPFYEFYSNSDEEYAPNELGFGLDEDFEGKYTAHEGLIFLCYGVNDWLAVEFEAAVIGAKLKKAADDPSAMPDMFSESGLGDVEGQIRCRWNRESESIPEIFNYFETVLPLQKNRDLIGTSDWEFKLGVGATKGFDFGTMTVRQAIEYIRSEDAVELGESAIEYLKRLSREFRVYAGVEGTQDEVTLIGELQWLFADNMLLKCGSGFGITPKATDFAPEIGVMFSF